MRKSFCGLCIEWGRSLEKREPMMVQFFILQSQGLTNKFFYQKVKRLAHLKGAQRFASFFGF
jgi:hypothetical protein